MRMSWLARKAIRHCRRADNRNWRKNSERKSGRSNGNIGNRDNSGCGCLTLIIMLILIVLALGSCGH